MTIPWIGGRNAATTKSASIRASLRYKYNGCRHYHSGQNYGYLSGLGAPFRTMVLKF
jgi:hypothetical protein